MPISVVTPQSMRKVELSGPYVEGGLELPARAESIPAPDDCKSHDRRTSPL